MIESRCGIQCNECGFRVSQGCPGCLHIQKPFWADVCPVKDCVEAKNLNNCGECENFPCSLANSFAYDEKQGDGGKRLDNCREWCGCKKG